MWEDPIVSDIHRVREELSAKFDFDVKAIFADMRQRQWALGEKLIHQRNCNNAEPADAADRNMPGGPSVGQT